MHQFILHIGRGRVSKSPAMISSYARALGMLSSVRRLATALIAANIAIGVVQLAEPILFGRVVDAISRNMEAMPFIGLWGCPGTV